ncbi:MAG: RidA family protein [Pseudomonadota bacterium]
MNNKQAIETQKAPIPLGPYSQAVKAGNTVYLSGQIPLNLLGDLLEGNIETQTRQVFDNLKAVAEAAGGDLNQCVKLTIFLTDLDNFSVVNNVMVDYFKSPYPARSTIEVSGLPKGAKIEIEGTMVL